ncbi:MAG: hypothetical protein CL878_15550 [Dehalococcoidia bacterium]|nr:hypothetical protein [Dehalococcoidia bacterium]
MTATGRPDVAIIGGGVMGCALAYYLARTGESVTLLEQGRVGSVPSASGASAAIVNVPVTAPEALMQQSLLTHKLLPELAAELPQQTGIDIGFTRPGSVRPAFGDHEHPGLQSLVERYAALGHEAEWLDAKGIRTIEPGISRLISGGVYAPGTSSLYAPHYVRALAAGAAAHGAVIREGMPVTGLQRSGDRVEAITTVDGQIEAGQVVLATGAWTGMVSAWLGVGVPIGPQRGQIMAVQTRPPMPHVHHILSHDDGYVVPKPNGTAVVGATREFVGWDGRLTPGGLGFLVDLAHHLVPTLTEGTVKHVWYGFRPMRLDDGPPLVGQLPGLRNVSVVAGHGPTGIALSAAVGYLLAQSLRGEDPQLSLAPFDPARSGISAA